MSTARAARDCISEDTAVQPSTLYARTKYAAEQLVLAARARNGHAIGVALRLAAVYGPQLKGNYRRLIRSLQRGPALRIGSGENRRTLISEWDVGRAVLLAATHPDAAGRVYNVSDGRVHTLNQIVAVINAALGRKNRTIALPFSCARAVARLADGMLTPFGLSPGVTQAVEKDVEDIAVDGSSFSNDLGFRPELDLANGWRRTIAELIQSGRL